MQGEGSRGGETLAGAAPVPSHPCSYFSHPRQTAAKCPPPPAEKPPTGGQLRGGRSIEMILVLEKTVFIRENAYGSTSFPKTAHFLGPTWKREGRGSGQEQRNLQSAGAGSVAVGHVPSSRPRGRVLQGCAPCPPVVSQHLTWRPERRWFPAGGNRRHPLKHPRPLTLTS